MPGAAVTQTADKSSMSNKTHQRAASQSYQLNNNNNSGSNNSNSNSVLPSRTECNKDSSVEKPNLCAGCGQAITDRYMLQALGRLWHEDCLKCGCCSCRLGEVGSSLFTRANLILCRRDYLRLFGNTGYCSACNRIIPAFEMVMRAKNNVYHLECFACQQCNHRFCVGDKFYLCDNKILCEYDYEERLVFASLAFNPSVLAQIKQSSNQLPQCPTISTPSNCSSTTAINNGSGQHPPSSHTVQSPICPVTASLTPIGSDGHSRHLAGTSEYNTHITTSVASCDTQCTHISEASHAA